MRKYSSSLCVFVHMRKISLMYLVSRRVFFGCELINFSSMVDIKMLAMVGKNVAPIAVPMVCWNIRCAKAKLTFIQTLGLWD